MTLNKAIKTLSGRNPSMLLADGATTYDIPNLLESLADEGENMDREVVIGEHNGRAVIQAVNSNGYVSTGEPLYREVEAE